MKESVHRIEKEYPKLASNFKKVLEEQYELFSGKCLDYGVSNISLGADLKQPKDRMFALHGLWFRMMDKMNRWKNLMQQTDKNVNFESLEDTFKDIANYAVIAKLVFTGNWNEEKSAE